MTASLCDVVAEWSKASRLGRDPFAGVGSNPIHISGAILSNGSAPQGPEMRAALIPVNGHQRDNFCTRVFIMWLTTRGT